MVLKTRKILPLFLLLATCFTISLQAGTKDSAAGLNVAPRTADIPSTNPKNYTWGTAYDDLSYSAVAGKDAVFVAGSSAVGPIGGYDAFLAKFDLTGELVLLEWWGGAGPDTADGVGVDGAGNIYVVGATQSFGYFWRQVEIIKYKPSGELLWNTTWGDSGDEYASDAFVSADGMIYVAGTDVTGTDNAMLIKCSSDGNVLWNKTFGGSGADNGQAVVVDSARNIYIAGITNSWGAGGRDVFLVKYDKNGVKLFNQTWGGPGDDYVYDICIDSSDEVTLTGYTDSWTTGGDIDVLMLHYDENGVLKWNTTWGGPANDNAWGICAEWDGSYLVTGNTESSGGLGRNVLFASFSNTGALLWNTTWANPGGNYWEEGTAIMRIGNQVIISGICTVSAPWDILLLYYDMPLPLAYYTPLWITLGIAAAVLVFILIIIRRKRK